MKTRLSQALFLLKITMPRCVEIRKSKRIYTGFEAEVFSCLLQFDVKYVILYVEILSRAAEGLAL